MNSSIPRQKSIELLTFDGRFRGQVPFKEKIVSYNRTSDNSWREIAFLLLLPSPLLPLEVTVGKSNENRLGFGGFLASPPGNADQMSA